MKKLTAIILSVLLAISCAATLIACQTKPGLPQNLEAAAGNGCVTVSWEAPKSSNFVTGYEICIVGKDWIELSAETFSYTFLELENGREYTFAVRAKNANGSGLNTQIKATPVYSAEPISLEEFFAAVLDPHGNFKMEMYGEFEQKIEIEEVEIFVNGSVNIILEVNDSESGSVIESMFDSDFYFTRNYSKIINENLTHSWWSSSLSDNSDFSFRERDYATNVFLWDMAIIFIRLSTLEFNISDNIYTLKNPLFLNEEEIIKICRIVITATEITVEIEWENNYFNPTFSYLYTFIFQLGNSNWKNPDYLEIP